MGAWEFVSSKRLGLFLMLTPFIFWVEVGLTQGVRIVSSWSRIMEAGRHLLRSLLFILHILGY